jgi:hypothetical protein
LVFLDGSRGVRPGISKAALAFSGRQEPGRYEGYSVKLFGNTAKRVTLGDLVMRFRGEQREVPPAVIQLAQLCRARRRVMPAAINGRPGVK